jgi:hypothetical protein
MIFFICQAPLENKQRSRNHANITPSNRSWVSTGTSELILGCSDQFYGKWLGSTPPVAIRPNGISGMMGQVMGRSRKAGTIVVGDERP